MRTALIFIGLKVVEVAAIVFVSYWVGTLSIHIYAKELVFGFWDVCIIGAGALASVIGVAILAFAFVMLNIELAKHLSRKMNNGE